MPRLNYFLILFAVLTYFATAGITLRDRLLIHTLHKIERAAVAEPTAEQLFAGAMHGLSDVCDEYTVYIPYGRQTDYQNELDNRYKGFGFRIRQFPSLHNGTDSKRKTTFISFPLLHSPAFQAGLQSGDQITAVNGISVETKPLDEIMAMLLKIKGKKAAEVTLSVIPYGTAKPKDFKIKPDVIHSRSVEGDYIENGKPVFCLETKPDIGYIRITSFSETTVQEFRNALDQIMQSGAEGIVLDLRDNPGGYLVGSVEIAQMFLQPQPELDIVVAAKYRSGYEEKHRLASKPPRCLLPVAVLINGSTASAAEILSAALQDYRRAAIFGTRSFGKGVVQQIYELPFHSGIFQMTGASYRSPLGRNIHRKPEMTESDEWGIIPDNIIELTETEQQIVRDYRTLRSNAVSGERESVLEFFLQQFLASADLPDFPPDTPADPPFCEGSPSSSPSPRKGVMSGTSPFYDRQLEEAVRFLTEKTPRRTKSP
ncbi:MAG: S41 family peptidase [Planctomycetaceae bacterium]|jgi:carboxyl-terminal processing protease|nr:S41 family peptidase [Planctomycetaceae bacterium]